MEPDIDAAAVRVQQLAAEHEDFKIALSYDFGALAWGVDDPLDAEAVTAAMVADLTDAHSRFMAPGVEAGAQACLELDDRPVIAWFPRSDVAAPDLGVVRAAMDALDPPPVLFDLNPDADASEEVDGFFSWVKLEGEWGEPYLSWFYETMALSYPDHSSVGAAWPGFDDSLASWNEDRFMDGRCGQTLYDTLALTSAKGSDIDLLQLVTWNDYEEGTAVEPGVDACLEIEATVERSGDRDLISWTVTGPSGLKDRQH